MSRQDNFHSNQNSDGYSPPKLDTDTAIHEIENLLQQIPGGIAAVHGSHYVHTLVNPVYQRLFSRDGESLIGKTIREVFPDVEGQRIYDVFERVVRSGSAQVANEFQVIIKRGLDGVLEQGYFNVVAQPIKDEQGIVSGILIYTFDVTDQVIAQQRLEESEARFQAIVNQNTVGMAQSDLNGKYVFVNKRYCDMVGYSREELLEKSMADITHPDDLARNEELLERIRRQEGDFVLEMRYIHKNGSDVWVNNSVSLIRDGSGTPQYILTISPEITEAKEIQRLIIEQQRQAAILEERQRLARQLHDSVNQSLYSSLVIAETLPRLWKRDPEKATQRTEQIVMITRGALAEMRLLLIELRPEAIIRSKMHDLLRQLGERAQGHKSLDLVLDIQVRQEILPADVQVALYRIAEESINNMIKHSQAAQLKLTLHYDVDQVTLRIEDNGQGFDQQTTLAGIGWTTMRERAAAIGASLSIDSAVGKGTRIILVWNGSDLGPA